MEDLPERNEEKQIPAYKFRCPLQQSYEHMFKQQFLAMQNSRSIAMIASRSPKDCLKKGISAGNVECRSRKMKILKEQNLVDSRALIRTVHFFSLRLKTKAPPLPTFILLDFFIPENSNYTRALCLHLRTECTPGPHTFILLEIFIPWNPPAMIYGEFQHHPNRCSEWGIGSTLVGRIQVWY